MCIANYFTKGQGDHLITGAVFSDEERAWSAERGVAGFPTISSDCCAPALPGVLRGPFMGLRSPGVVSETPLAWDALLIPSGDPPAPFGLPILIPPHPCIVFQGNAFCLHHQSVCLSDRGALNTHLSCLLLSPLLQLSSCLPSEKAMATHSSTLACKEEPGRPQSMGSQRLGHDWATSLSLFTFMHWRRKWQPTPVFLPGESQRRGSLVGCCLWGRTESDTTEAT